MPVLLREPMSRQQGLKFLLYGGDGTGKSVMALSFPSIALVDTESKVGVYEKHPVYGKNLVSIADTTTHYEAVEVAEMVLKNRGKYKTFEVDSETNLYDSMQVAMLEVEEKKAKKWHKDVDDAIVAQRGWGKIKLNNARLKNLRVQLSSAGITVISIAHSKPVYDKEDKTTVIGEEPELKRGSKHDYDVILRFVREEKNGEFIFKCIVEKDTSNTHKIGSVIINPSYADWVSYMDSNSAKPVIAGNYMQAIDDQETKAMEELDFPKFLSELKALIREKGGSKDERVMSILKKYEPVGNINKIDDMEVLKTLKSEIEVL